MRVLVVCSANVCRSPLFAAQLRARGAQRVDSAGVQPHPVAIPEGLQEAYRIMGLSLPTQTGRSVIDVADSEVALYLAADREVLRELVASDPTRWPTSFTIKEFARAVNNSALDARLEEIRRDAHVGRRASDLLAPSITDDVADPGLYASPEAYLAMARELERLASVIAPVLAT